MDDLKFNDIGNVTPEVSGNASDVMSSDSASSEENLNGFQRWWRDVSNGWNDFWDRLVNFGEQSQVGNNAIATLGTGIASGDTSFQDALQGVLDASGTSAQSAGSTNFSSFSGSSALANNDFVQAYYDLYEKTGNDAYLEKMIDYAANLQATSSARDWEKMMSDTTFSRLVDDIKKAGYNPWLALQSGIGQTSSSSLGASSVPSSSASSQATSTANSVRSTNAEIISNVIRALIFVAMVAMK